MRLQIAAMREKNAKLKSDIDARLAGLSARRTDQSARRVAFQEPEDEP